ncbi:peptidoglycan editing factor PgeF [Syntrophorhabdus aromaticivorans]|uniref:peptidoglycan editing factor PgeF n=1 Tax=Syntrophorhabdus aromaticivorans TaxID=328301 RepID=UPI0003F722D2|nr:peptidoglycan editing factor PgeF [Syntrophorhabdus aromaticivorans]
MARQGAGNNRDDGMFELTHSGGWSFFHVPELGGAGISHGFCTGASPSELLNEDTRKRFLDTFLLKDIVVMEQVHGNTVHTIINGEKPESGDGLVLVEKGIAGIIRTADCLPVILCDTSRPLVSIVHAGWRGTAGRIIEKAVDTMERLGAAKESMVALLGPSIGPCCYEVKGDVRAVFCEEGFPERIFHERGRSMFLDLKEANAWALRARGVRRIYDTGLCTCCEAKYFYSFRRGDKGRRQISFVSIAASLSIVQERGSLRRGIAE